jgi:hypothetical protein
MPQLNLSLTSFSTKEGGDRKDEQRDITDEGGDGTDEQEDEASDHELSVGTMNVLLCSEVFCKWQNVRNRDHFQSFLFVSSICYIVSCT